MAAIMMYGMDKKMARELTVLLKHGKNEVRVCSASSSVMTDENGQLPVILMNSEMKWSECRPLLKRFSEAGLAVIFLTNDQNMINHLQAVYNGPSDVLTFPVSEERLLSRIAKFVREDNIPPEISVDESEKVAMLDGKRVELTSQEFALLTALMENPDMPVSREQLLKTAWGYQSMGETRTVDVHVQRLRKKLGSNLIETVYKCGYRLRMAYSGIHA